MAAEMWTLCSLSGGGSNNKTDRAVSLGSSRSKGQMAVEAQMPKNVAAVEAK